jgi:hypothetical protein
MLFNACCAQLFSSAFHSLPAFQSVIPAVPVICYLLSSACYPLLVIHCLLFCSYYFQTSCYSVLVICCLLFSACYAQLCYLVLVICCLLSSVWHLPVILMLFIRYLLFIACLPLLCCYSLPDFQCVTLATWHQVLVICYLLPSACHPLTVFTFTACYFIYCLLFHLLGIHVLAAIPLPPPCCPLIDAHFTVQYTPGSVHAQSTHGHTTKALKGYIITPHQYLNNSYLYHQLFV